MFAVVARASSSGSGMVTPRGSSQPLARAMCALEQVRPLAGASVAVIGQGPIGLLFGHLARTAGARHVIGVDRVDRSGVAGVYGVHETVHAPSDRWVASLGTERPTSSSRRSVTRRPR